MPDMLCKAVLCGAGGRGDASNKLKLRKAATNDAVNAGCAACKTLSQMTGYIMQGNVRHKARCSPLWP